MTDTDLARDRARGCLVCAALGDAFGMPLEFGPPRRGARQLRTLSPGRLPAGSFTDDTEMMLALGESLLHSAPLDPADLASRFVAWYRERPPDVGIHTGAVLRRVAAGAPWEEAASAVQLSNPDSAGNGSVMRCFPVALAHADDPAACDADSRLQSRVTHPHEECVAACAFVNAAIRRLLHGDHPEGAVEAALAESAPPPALAEAIRLAAGRRPEELPNTGWVRHTVESAVWGLLTTGSYPDAVIAVANLGNDADTAAAVAGALAGAAYGLAGIPAEWREALGGEWPLGSGARWGWGEFAALADGLLEGGTSGAVDPTSRSPGRTG
jgi:ADP-ribosyl-[dinitrogen reductase] hydrolase